MAQDRSTSGRNRRSGSKPGNSRKSRHHQHRPADDTPASLPRGEGQQQQQQVASSPAINASGELPGARRTVDEADPSAPNTRSARMDAISGKLAVLDGRRQELAKKLDDAQKQSDYELFQRIGNNYLGTILQSIDLYIELIKEISSEPVSDELKNEFSEIVKKGSKSQGIESQSEWISNDVSPLYEKVRQICACVYAAVAKIDQEATTATSARTP